MLPGQLLRFEGVKPAYGKVSEVHALPALVPGTPEGYALLIELLHGTPGLGAQKVTLLSTAQMAREVQKLQPSIEHPLQFAGHFVGELANLGALTLVEGDDFLLKYDALQVVINAVKPYRRLLIIDPLGLFEEGDGFTYLKAGQDVRLSIQQVGSKRFLQAFGELFSPELRVPALRTLADHWPLLGSEGEFVPFSRLLNLEAAVNLPLKNLLVHHYQTLLQSRVFADSPEQTLNLGQALRQPICIVDVSDMPAPWKHLFYEQLCETVFREGGGGLVPVLLYPEKYLPDLPAWAQRAEEVGFNMLVMASPFAAESLRDKANNRVWVDSREAMELKGSLTLGLPVSFPLPMHTWEESSAQQPATTQQTMSGVQYEESSMPPEAGLSTTLLGVSSPQGMDFTDVSFQQAGTEQFATTQPGSTIPQKDTESRPETAVPFEVALPEEDAPDADLAQPVIDLSSPPPEPTITFLTAEQLSELLASSPKVDEEGTETLEDWEERMPSEEVSDYPDAENIPQQTRPASLSASPSINIPVLFEDEPDDSHESGDDAAGFAYSSFQVDLDDMEGESPVAPASSVYAEEPAASESPSMPPPFPAPEEYEREEFSFDLNPDDWAERSETENGSAAGRQGVTDAVSRSLSEFEDMDLLADEPLFELNPEGELEQQPERQAIPPSRAVSVPVSGAPQTAAPLDEAEMQEALDLIFPQQMAGSEERSPESTPAPVPVESPVQVVGEDEQMPVYQKPDVPLPTKTRGYQVGDRVRHKTYGEGTIQKIIPMDETVILNISFETVGKRLLDPSLCELRQDPD